MIRKYTMGELKSRFAQLKYPWPTDRYSLIGIRKAISNDNQFDDLLIWIDMGDPKGTPVWPKITYGVGTTIPGRFYLLNLLNPKGCAILKEGQWKDCWQVGLHNGYTAFVQAKPVTVYRDNNKNFTPEELAGTEDMGMFGIDIHRAAKTGIAKLIENFSAGCQVWDDPTIFDTIIKQASQSEQKFFTYTLIPEW